MERAGHPAPNGNLDVQPMAVPGVHDRFLVYFLQTVGAARPLKVLDVGAGQGAMSKRLHEAGFAVSACDLAPEQFHFPAVECKRIDLSQAFPYADASFDALIAVELAEHLLDHQVFFAECARILVPAGKLLLSTPNILSLKSRLRFLLTGFHYSFDPLEPERDDGLQHVSSLTLDQYRYAAHRHGLQLKDVSCDILQRGSLALLWLWPFLWFGSLYLRVNFRLHNRLTPLLGRKLFLMFEKSQALPRPTSSLA